MQSMEHTTDSAVSQPANGKNANAHANVLATAPEEESLGGSGLFEEPEEYFKPESEPTFKSYHRKGCGDEGTCRPHVFQRTTSH
jgi:hypothetical protein